MLSTSKPMTDEELEAFEATRDIGAELLQSIHEMKAGKGKVVYSPVTLARNRSRNCSSRR